LKNGELKTFNSGIVCTKVNEKKQAVPVAKNIRYA